MFKDKKIVFSGGQPSGTLTIGNYLGAIRNFTAFPEDHHCYYCVVDEHAITVRQVPADLRRRTSAKHADNINAGLFTYPSLMAADILLYQTDLVPVGSDQKQHLELSRDIAMRFNGVYSDTFTVPEPYIPEAGARIMSLADPTKKMSKSDENENAVVRILDDRDAIIRKFKRAVTDSGSEVRRGEGKDGVGNLMSIYSAFTGKTDEEIEREFEGRGYGEFKAAVGEACADALAPVKAEFDRLMGDKKYLEDVMAKGAAEAKQNAARTMSKVRRKIGFIEARRPF